MLRSKVLGDEVKPEVDINSPEFNAGVEAGRKPPPATNDWQAGLELGQVLKAEDENKTAGPDIIAKAPSLPLFLRDGSEGGKHNAQDEKDGSEE